MRKLIHGERSSHFQGHTAERWCSRGSMPGSWAPRPMFVVTVTYSLVQAEDLNQKDLVVEPVGQGQERRLITRTLVDGDAIHCPGVTGQGSLVDKVGHSDSQFGPSGLGIQVQWTSRWYPSLRREV